MNAGFVLQIIAIAIGGGSVQLAIFLLKRRAELRSLDAASDATLLNSANAYIATLQAGEKSLRLEVEALKTEILVLKQAWSDERASMRKEWDGERLVNTESMEASNRQVSRLRQELANVRADLMDAQVQIDGLRARMPHVRGPEDNTT